MNIQAAHAEAFADAIVDDKRFDPEESEALAALARSFVVLSAEVERLRQLINTDKTGLAFGLCKVREFAKSYGWIARGEWGSYDYEEQTTGTLQREVARLLALIEETSAAALRESGQRADSAFRLVPDAPREEVAGG